jgi:hypothetical protein
MAEETYYIKKGRKYVPVSYYNSKIMDGLPLGSHLTVVQPGISSRRYNVDPAFAPMIAAAMYAKNAISDAILQNSGAIPVSSKLTQEQLDAFEIFKKSLGRETFSMTHPSVNDSVEKGMVVMQNEANKLLSCPAVKKAYDNFILLAQLAYKNNEI